MRIVQLSFAAAMIVMTATPVGAMRPPPHEPGTGGSSSGGTSVPEPAGLAMMGSAVAGYAAAVALHRRKKRKNK